jgi:hypothetical protein
MLLEDGRRRIVHRLIHRFCGKDCKFLTGLEPVVRTFGARAEARIGAG